MERVWEDSSPHAKFWRQLLNSRVDELISSPEWLKSLRFNHPMVKWWNKNAGYIFEERGLNLYQLIAQSFGECWDEEDEQKCAHAKEENVLPPMVKRKDKPRQEEDAIRLDHPCEIGVRSQEEEEPELQVRSSNEGRQSDLQEGLGREELYRRAGGTEEASAEKKKPNEESGGRRRVVAKQHTAGLGNVEEGRLAEKAAPAVKQRRKKRPQLGSQFKMMN
jgi:hypothetical protein